LSWLSYEGHTAAAWPQNISEALDMTTFARLVSALAALLFLGSGVSLAQQQLSVEMHKVSDAGVGEKIGTITISEGEAGVRFKVAVSGIPAGPHGFHVHQKGDCGTAVKDEKAEPAGAAGPHYDPGAKKTHKGPAGAGHAGDLPVLTATASGIDETVEAPRLKLADIRGRALVIHEGGDNYTDNPANGGGGSRIACGVAPKS
jgi:Cu-Zn family superoxide dismutase